MTTCVRVSNSFTAENNAYREDVIPRNGARVYFIKAQERGKILINGRSRNQNGPDCNARLFLSNEFPPLRVSFTLFLR